jgi:arginine-tRNA-protein transferase
MSNLQTLVFYATPEHDCSYLADKQATTVFVDPKAKVDLDIYTQLSNLGFRRSGNHYYRPHCKACNACIPIRIPVTTFRPSRSQKRILKLNKNVEVRLMSADFHEDHYLIYEKYIHIRHADGDMFPPSREQYRSFLIEGPSITRFAEFSLNGQVIGVAVVDILIDGYSAIYTFFDPDYAHLSLGTYAILWQIQAAKEKTLPFLYLGYFIKACTKMSYKTAFKPFEAHIENTWLSEEAMQKLVDNKVLP